MASPIPRKLKKGELLFNEGDPSKSMYFVQTGSLRLFKRKGNGSIELGTIHKGEVVGEMGFLDGGPRSAAAEAAQDTELLEVTNTNLAEQLKAMPPWLPVLLRTVVNRLRSANNKIRQLESASMAYTYGSEGVSTNYQFLSVYDVMKVCTGLLTVAARASNPDGNGVRCPLQRINRYANQIMGIHQNKINEMLDILERAGLVKIDRPAQDKVEVFVRDVDHLETLIVFMNEENLKDHAKKTQFSVKAVNLMGYMVKHLAQFPPDAEGVCSINFAKILEIERAANDGKEPFRLDEFSELVKAKIATDLAVKDSHTVITRVHARNLGRMYSIQKIIKEIESVNEQKREQTQRSAGAR